MLDLVAHRFSLSRVLPLIIGVILLSACAGGTPVTRTESHVSSWQAGHLIEVKTGRSIELSTFLSMLTRYDIVYLGEEHYNQHHIDAAITLLRTVLADGRYPILTMEMFGWDGQPALDEYLSAPDHDRQLFLDQVHWKQNWGGNFENYETLVNFSREHRLTLRAMNPPKPLIRRVVRDGLSEARKGSDWTEWGMDREEIVDDQAYRTRILDQLKRCHGGGSDDDYIRMYEASMVRDEGMAKTVAEAFLSAHRAQQSRAVILSYTGGGHIQFNLPVPKRVTRRLGEQIRQVTVYLTSFDQTRLEDIQELVHDGIADYLWLTPVSQQGPPQRCR